MRIAALVCRSFYSLLRGAVSAQRLVRKAAEYGYGAIALADVNTMCGVVDFCRAAEQANIKPIIAVEILTDSQPPLLHLAKQNGEGAAGQKAVLLVEDKTGYKNLCRITTARNLDGNFDLIEQLKNNSKGIICICDQPKLLTELKRVFHKDYLFAGCRRAEDVDFAAANKIMPIAYTNFNFLEDDDIATARLLAKIRQLRVVGPGPQDTLPCDGRVNRLTPPSRWGGFRRLVPEEQFKRQFRSCPQAISNAEQIIQRCNFQLLNGRYYLPEVQTLPCNGRANRLTPPSPWGGFGKDKSADRELARLCHVGLAKRFSPVSKEVIKRLEHELATIRANTFSDYFLVVYQIVNFAKQNNIPVEVRGSAAGSLVAYVLGFTRVCPIENNLYFERFMNPGRTDCPDIDIDLCWRRRDEVIRFCYEHWGFANVAMVCNINRYRPASAIRDTARALGFEPAQINQLAKQARFSILDPRSSSGIQHPASSIEHLRLADRLVGIPRHLGVHCGGIIITPRPVRDIAPLEMANKGVIITQYDKDAAEAVGLVKIDLLGNRALSTVNEAVNIITKEQENIQYRSKELRTSKFLVGHSTFRVDAVDPADQTTARMLSAGDSLGVFQSESPGMRQLLRALKVKSKKDLAIALSLIRPGPASGGMKAEFIERYVNKKPFEYIHPKMKELLGDTYGVMLYQEDVMRIAVEVAGYSIADADRFRSEVSKKVSALRLQGQYADFVYSKATAAGIDRQSAEAIWDEILRFAAYSYCKAHATVYANIAWQTAYLKANYPCQFYCSLLNNHHGMYPLRIYVWDAKRHGIKVLPPHVNYSEIEWRLQGLALPVRAGAAPRVNAGANPAVSAVRAGLGIIKALSCNSAKAIVSERAIRPFSDLDDLARRVKFRKGELQNLIHVGACDGLASGDAQLMLFRDPGDNLQLHRASRLQAELELTGIPFCWHPALLLRIKSVPAARLSGFIGRTVTVAGFIATARRARTNDGRVMGFVTLEDSTGLAEVSFFPDQIQLYRSICSSGGPVWIKGRVTEHLSSITLECSDCGKLAPSPAK